MAGAAFLQIYIDAPSIQPPSASQLDVFSQSWLGAWWLGMVIFGVVACLPAIPVLLFPRRLPTRPEDGSGEGVSMSLESSTANTTAVSWFRCVSSRLNLSQMRYAVEHTFVLSLDTVVH